MVRRAGAEAAVITVGVLLALAADEWREQNHRAAQETLLLEGLLSEFRSNGVELEAVRAQHRDALEASASLLRTALGGSPSERSVPDLLSVVLLSNWRFDPTSGALDAYLAGGDLGLIRNADLRAALTEWPRRVDEVWQQEARILAFVDGQAAEFALTELDRLSLIGRGSGGGGPASAGGELREQYRPEVDMHEVLKLRRLQNLTTLRMTLTQATVQKYRGLARAHERVVALLTAELAAGV